MDSPVAHVPARNSEIEAALHSGVSFTVEMDDDERARKEAEDHQRFHSQPNVHCLALSDLFTRPQVVVDGIARNFSRCTVRQS